MGKRALTLTALLLLGANAASAQDRESAAKEWFREARFGMFIHWGSTAFWARVNG
jgi:Alpha-L-fucosidase